MLVEPDLDGFEVGHRGCRRVRPVRRLRHDDRRPPVVAGVLEVLADHEYARELTLGAGHRLQRDRGEAGDLRQKVLYLVHDPQGALDLIFCLQGMEPGEARHRGGGLVGARVVLHRAGAEGVEVRVYPPVLAREVGVVTDHGRLVHLGEARLLFASRVLGEDLVEVRLLHVELREGVAAPALAAFVPDQVTQHSKPPPRRRRAPSSSSSPCPPRASPPPPGPALRRSRPPATPRWLSLRPAARPRTPTKTVRRDTAARSLLRRACSPDSVPLRRKVLRPRISPRAP